MSAAKSETNVCNSVKMRLDNDLKAARASLAEKDTALDAANEAKGKAEGENAELRKRIESLENVVKSMKEAIEAHEKNFMINTQ